MPIQPFNSQIAKPIAQSIQNGSDIGFKGGSSLEPKRNMAVAIIIHPIQNHLLS